MKIREISYNKPTIKTNFKAGKVHLFSDFDRTYLPSSHIDFQSNYDKNFYENITNYFNNFRKFLNNTKGGLNFTITTGRTFDEFSTMAYVARERKIDMPLPDTLICKNGSDEYLRTGTDADFYSGGEYPFKYGITNKQKEESIKKLTNWDGPKIKEKLTEIFKKYDLQLVEGGSEHSPSDYGALSLFSEGKLKYESNINFQGTDLPEWKVGLRKDGNCKIFYTFPFRMYSNKERKNAALDINKQIDDYLNNGLHVKFNRISHNVEKVKSDCGFRPYEILEPAILDRESLKNIEIKGEKVEECLTKVYDVEQAIAKAAKNNDLVLVSGDSSNDYLMLNPFSYLKKAMRNIPGIKDKEGEILSNPKKGLELLNNNPKLAKEFMDMPFFGVIVKNHKKNKGLEPLIEAFTKGKYQKIIYVEEGHLQDGIKEAIKLYAENNKKYKAKLAKSLLKEVYGIIKPSGGGYTKTIIAATTVICGAYYMLNLSDSNKGKNRANKHLS